MVSNVFKEAAYAQETEEVIIALLTITSENLTQPIRVASDPYEVLPIAGVRGVVSRGEEFIFLPFEIEMPRDDKTGIVSAKLVIENVSRDIVKVLRETRTAVDLKIEVVLSNDVDLVEETFDELRLYDVNYNALTIEGRLGMDYFEREPVPYGRFTPANFPGMF